MNKESIMTQFYIRHDIKHQDETTIANRIAGVNFKLKRKANLYWVHTADMVDPKTEGYIGVCLIKDFDKRLKAHKNKFKKSNFQVDNLDSLLITPLMFGTYGEMNAQEAVYRPYMGIGWNYLYGGGATFNLTYLTPKNWIKWAKEKLAYYNSK